MLVGYVRIGRTDDSRAARLQREVLLAAGVEPKHIHDEARTRKREHRPQLAACLKALRQGDTLLVWRLDRLSCNLRHLVNTVHGLSSRGIGIKVLAGPGAGIDTTAASGGSRAVSAFAALAEFDREMTAERSRRGSAAARASTRWDGRPRKMTIPKLEVAVAAMAVPGSSVSGLCKKLRITRQTLYRHVDPQGNLRPDGEKLLRGRKCLRRTQPRSNRKHE